MSVYVRRDSVELPFPEGVNDGFGHWLAGFVDGEGHFGILSKGAHAYACRFSVSLRSDDLAILEECQQRTGLGSIYRRPQRAGARPCAVWTVASHQHCDALAAVFRRYPLRSKKARDFEVWCRALEAWKVVGRHRGGPGRWNGPVDQSAMVALKRELEDIRAWKDPHA